MFTKYLPLNYTVFHSFRSYTSVLCPLHISTNLLRAEKDFNDLLHAFKWLCRSSITISIFPVIKLFFKSTGIIHTLSVFPSVWILVRLRASWSSSRSDTSSSSSGVWEKEYRNGLLSFMVSNFSINVKHIL